MSTLKVNTVLSADTPTVNISDGLNVTGVSTVANLTAATVTSTNIVNSTKLSHRNLVINGGMRVAQRGTSSTTTGLQTVDRFAVYHSTSDAPTQEQVDVSTSDLPFTQAGLTKALKVTNGNQSSAGVAEYVEINYKFEAQDIKNSGWDHTSSSSKLTLSFWARSSVGQTFTAWFTNRDGTRQNFVFTYTLAANTWTKITKEIPGNSNLTIDNNNGAALELWMQMFYGTNYTQSSPPGNNSGDWVGHDNETVIDNTTTWYLTNDATFELTGVQLEVGSVATPFEHRKIEEELALCQRYYYRVTPGSSNKVYGWGMSDNDGTNIYIIFPFPTKMRSIPTAVEQNGTATHYRVRRDTTKDCSGVPTFVDATNYNARVNFPSASHGWGTGQFLWGMTGNSSSYIGFSAEL